MKGTFHITKTFESKQKSERNSLDLLVVHPTFWGELPVDTTPREEVFPILSRGGTVRLHVPGYAEFFAKPIEYGNTRNGSYLLCGLLANTRQGIGVAGAYLIDPEQIATGKMTVLRNSDRYPIRELVVHYPSTDISVEIPKKSTSILDREIPALAVLDKKIF